VKTYKELACEVDESLSFSQRKAVGRRMKMMAKKSSVKFKKARNKLKPLPPKMALKKGQKALRHWVMQKIAGKGKNISHLAIAQKERLEKQADKRMKGGKFKALAKKFAKKIMKKHRDFMIKAKEKKAEG